MTRTTHDQDPTEYVRTALRDVAMRAGHIGKQEEVETMATVHSEGLALLRFIAENGPDLSHAVDLSSLAHVAAGNVATAYRMTAAMLDSADPLRRFAVGHWFEPSTEETAVCHMAGVRIPRAWRIHT